MFKTVPEFVLTFLLFCVVLDINAVKIKLSKEEICDIGYRIYKNECGLKPENLTHWNEGENFASMGIGHFLWYPKGSRQTYKATFPKLLAYLKENNIKLPSWLEENYYNCPWSSQSLFNENFNSPRMRSLRKFLKKTMYCQTIFIIYRFNDSIPKLLKAAERRGTEKHVVEQLNRMARSYLGMYVLIDYVNFKGAGTNPDAGQWGLLQVLENMKGTEVGRTACYDFAKSAAYVLKKRVQNSSNRVREIKWYAGWLKRLETYYM
ncbi:MAG: hypothetical protein K9L78_00595 [Victivallales bacterium]|nr:hypothetical protein [Victivallales bacterium]MCF7888594.1 hypothetical protein [Victivallales bacterium]